MIATADDNTKTLTVRRNGEVVKTMPISMGKNSTPTNNGTYIVGDRFAHMVMDSSTYGVPSNSPNGYRTEVDCATQISYSGIYVHAAPWSVGSQGYSNVSHGCLNVSTSNAQWFYNNTKRGDIVEVANTVGSTCPAPTASATGTFRGSSGRPATPTSDARNAIRLTWWSSESAVAPATGRRRSRRELSAAWPAPSSCRPARESDSSK